VNVPGERPGIFAAPGLACLRTLGTRPMLPGPITEDAFIEVCGPEADDAGAAEPVRAVPPGCALVFQARIGVHAAPEPG